MGVSGGLERGSFGIAQETPGGPLGTATQRKVMDLPAGLELRAAIGRLPVKLRSVVVARYLLDWSTTDTAEALGIPQSTVKTRLKRALARLADELEGVEE
jgi:DNA-directed RNA polymerase specialized sigma24 family protein